MSHSKFLLNISTRKEHVSYRWKFFQLYESGDFGATAKDLACSVLCV
jgi:hypothetical protein